MIYNKVPLQLNNPVAFWLNFPDEERVFWVDRQSDRIVVGAKRLLFLSNQRTLNGLVWAMK